jgi:hypothetical protein
MALFLVFGIASAVSHHGFYSNMNGRETKGGGEQQWLLRYAPRNRIILLV